MYINEDEIGRMLGKLSILARCCWVKRLGYKYRDGDIVIIDIYANDGYGNINEVDIMEGIIMPTLGSGGFVTNNVDYEDELMEIGAIIPISNYSAEISGVTIHIDNENVMKFIKYGLVPNEDLLMAQSNLSDSMWSNDSSVEKVQIMYKPEGIYIVYPEEYIQIDEFIDDYLLFIQRIIEQVEEHEKNTIQREAA